MKKLSKLITAIKVLVVFIAVFQTGKALPQQQWKFHLAFEDANYQRDTIWFIWDSTATFHGIDTALGEMAVELNYSEFNVWIQNFYGDTTKTQALPYNHTHSTTIGAINFELPIIMTWDSSMFFADYLPPEPVGWVNSAKLSNDYFFFINNDHLNHVFDMTLTDSIIAPEPNNTDPWYWLPERHFPMGIELRQDPTIGLDENLCEMKSNIVLFPNPSSTSIFLRLKDYSYPLKVSIFSLTGKLEMSQEIHNNDQFIDISRLPTGMFILLVTNCNQKIYEKFIKN
ncbi:MAG TPA: T9SS type A sorting domain-containing protein [Bacteroidales bacterium]|nr:T9SS type A sorting domain-containing protein [Bacteroidales bacterium]